MMDLKEKLLAEMKQNELARANGRVMRALNVLYPSRNPAKSMTPISTTTSEKRTRKHVSNTVCTAFKRCFFDA